MKPGNGKHWHHLSALGHVGQGPGSPSGLDRWRTERGPLGAMICYLLELKFKSRRPAQPDGCSSPTARRQRSQASRSAPAGNPPCHQIQSLLGMSERLGWEAISHQAGCSDLRRGLDLTAVPRALRPATAQGALKMVWQEVMRPQIRPGLPCSSFVRPRRTPMCVVALRLSLGPATLSLLLDQKAIGAAASPS